MHPWCPLGAIIDPHSYRAGRQDGSGMGVDGRDGTHDRDSSVDSEHDVRLEPEVIRWLGMYAEAADATRDAAVAAIFDEVNGLLRRYRRESAAYRADYTSRLRLLTERMPVILWTTDAELRVTT